MSDVEVDELGAVVVAFPEGDQKANLPNWNNGTQSTSKSAPKFLPESQDENVCQPLCIGVGFRSNFKKIPTHTQDHVMHSNERGECCLRTHADRLRKR